MAAPSGNESPETSILLINAQARSSIAEFRAAVVVAVFRYANAAARFPSRFGSREMKVCRNSSSITALLSVNLPETVSSSGEAATFVRLVTNESFITVNRCRIDASELRGTVSLFPLRKLFNRLAPDPRICKRIGQLHGPTGSGSAVEPFTL